MPQIMVTYFSEPVILQYRTESEAAEKVLDIPIKSFIFLAI
jgi:hypothetical protein